MQRAAGQKAGTGLISRMGMVAAALAAAVTASACATAPERDTAVTSEARAPLGREQLESTMAAAVEEYLRIATDPELGIYLRGIAEALVRGSPGLAGKPVGVIVIEDRASRWDSYSIPGTRIYLSKGLLKSLEFESEIAAMIAIQLAHVSLDHPSEGREWKAKMSESELFGPAGALVYGERQVLAAVEGAARFLYTAGIDPRGLVSLCGRLQNGRTSSPYDPALLEKMRARTREVLTQFAPLRNPVIRSESFFVARERIRRL